MAENQNGGPWWRSLLETVIRQGVGWALLAVVVLWILHTVTVKLDGLELKLDTHNATSQQIVDQLKSNGDADQRDRRTLIRLQALQCRFNTEGQARLLCDEIANGGQ